LTLLALSLLSLLALLTLLAPLPLLGIPRGVILQDLFDLADLLGRGLPLFFRAARFFFFSALGLAGVVAPVPGSARGLLAGVVGRPLAGRVGIRLIARGRWILRCPDLR